MGQAKARGTYEERKALAVATHGENWPGKKRRYRRADPMSFYESQRRGGMSARQLLPTAALLAAAAMAPREQK